MSDRTRCVFTAGLDRRSQRRVLDLVHFVGCCFHLARKDEVRFDVITGIAAIVLFGIALPAVIAYVTFLKVERTAYLGVRLDYVYSIYVLFSIGVIIRYAALTWRALRGQPPDIQIGSGSAL